MTWENIRKNHPDCWVLIEAIDAKSENDKRVIEEMDVLEQFLDGNEAFKKYSILHKNHKDREYYIYHTSNAKLDIGIKKWLGVRL